MTPAPAKRYKTHGAAWYTPPADTPLNAPVPHTASTIQAQLTPFQRALYFAIKGANDSHKDPAKSKELGRDVYRAPGYSVLARGLQVDPKTVYRNAIALIYERRMFAAFERTGPKGERIGTWYVDRPWKEVLDDHIADPAIAKAIVNGKPRPLVISRGRHWMTPELAEQWGIRIDQVPESAELVDGEEIAAEEAIAAPPAAPPAAEAIDVLLLTLNEVCTTGADERDCVSVRKKASDANRDREISDETLAQLVRQIGHDERKREKRSVGLILDRLTSKVHKWRNEELRRTAEEARAAASRARYEAGTRERSIADYTKALADPDLPPDQRRAFEEMLAYLKGPPAARAG